MLVDFLYRLREKRPLVHCITNYVSASDIANFLYAAGAAPIMADAPEEVAEVTAKADALLLNLGTLNRDRMKSLLIAEQSAREHDKPCVLDPVGAGFNRVRGESALRLLHQTGITVLRGNSSELQFLSQGITGGHGVDAEAANEPKEAHRLLSLSRQCAERYHLIAGLSGPIDRISDGTRGYLVRNGHPLLTKVSGSGCMLSALIAALLAVAEDQPLEACVAAFVIMGVCGELAYERLCETGGGNASYRQFLIDALDTLQPESLAERAQYDYFPTI